jgi:hypothetical protein
LIKSIRPRVQELLNLLNEFVAEEKKSLLESVYDELVKNSIGRKYFLRSNLIIEQLRKKGLENVVKVYCIQPKNNKN